ncbi:hypothetical protein [Rivularia sp. UHCC 0363]|uniref:hypothetical protein n=1 Tax=Rivularia sp. UHCC 0363 TaxID=3110244 RepID=UPI002B22116B|nr:hypothetical protein [Rivularia sp. UHCC 0363]MEA5598072.1 hypothetical protein [Rivularia sp. UHCC 0363]
MVQEHNQSSSSEFEVYLSQVEHYGQVIPVHLPNQVLQDLRKIAQAKGIHSQELIIEAVDKFIKEQH